MKKIKLASQQEHPKMMITVDEFWNVSAQGLFFHISDLVAIQRRGINDVPHENTGDASVTLVIGMLQSGFIFGKDKTAAIKFCDFLMKVKTQYQKACKKNHDITNKVQRNVLKHLKETNLPLP